MGRQPEPRVNRMRTEWVYVGKIEAAVLARVSGNTIERWISRGDLVPARVERDGEPGRYRHVYRLDKVLALERNLGR